MKGIDKYKFSLSVLILNGIFLGITAFFVFFVPIVGFLGWTKCDEYVFNTMLIYAIIGCIYLVILYILSIKRIRNIVSNNLVFGRSVLGIFICFVLSLVIPFVIPLTLPSWMLIPVILLSLMFLGSSEKLNTENKGNITIYVIGFCISVCLIVLFIFLLLSISHDMGNFQIMTASARKHKMYEYYAGCGNSIGDLYFAKIPIKEEKNIGKTILSAKKICTDVGMRLPSKEDFEAISKNLDVNAFSDDYFRFVSWQREDNIPQSLLDWNGDYYTSSVNSDGKNIIYNIKTNRKQTCRFITPSSNKYGYNWRPEKICIKYSIEKPYFYPLSPQYKTNKKKTFHVICVKEDKPYLR